MTRHLCARAILVAAVATGSVAAGCTGGKPPVASTSSGVAKGSLGGYYYVNIFTPPIGGVVTSSIGGIVCGGRLQLLSRRDRSRDPASWEGPAAPPRQRLARRGVRSTRLAPTVDPGHAGGAEPAHRAVLANRGDGRDVGLGERDAGWDHRVVQRPELPV